MFVGSSSGGRGSGGTLVGGTAAACWLLVTGVPTVGGLLVVRVVCTPLLLVAASFHSLVIEPTSIHPRPFSFVRSSELLLQQTRPQERLRFFQRAHTVVWHFHLL